MTAHGDGLSDWLRSGRYLPLPLKDFHDQKDVFKSIWEVVMRKKEHDAKERGGMPYLSGLNWVDAQIFTIDQFLHFMAAHGWTLQRARKPFEFVDLDGTIKERRDREAVAFRKMLDEDAAKRSADTSNASQEPK